MYLKCIASSQPLPCSCHFSREFMCNLWLSVLGTRDKGFPWYKTMRVSVVILNIQQHMFFASKYHLMFSVDITNDRL